MTRMMCCVMVGLSAVLPAAGQAAGQAPVQAPASDHFTPVIVSPLTSSARPFPGTDGKYHVVYELLLTNTNVTRATLKKIEVQRSSKEGAASNVASYAGAGLLARLRTLGNTPVDSAEIEFNGSRLFLIDLVFDSRAEVPGRLLHTIELMGASGPSPKPMEPVALRYAVAPLDLHLQLPVIGPPLAGKGWVVINGCCDAGGAHRASGLAANGGIYYGQRFAIDWMRLDDAGRLVQGDPADVHHYSSYGAEVLAVADGDVVEVLDALGDQPPGKLPDPKTMTVANVLGNHVILDLGGGVYAFYAHMEKGSITVKKGQRVKRGEVLGKLGNSGNTSAPHLHFHLMEGRSALASNGMPYAFDSFALAGKIPAEKNPATADSLEESWKGYLFSPSPRHGEFPLDLNIINFPEAAGRK